MTLDDLDDRAVITVPEAAELLELSRTAAYEAARRGDIPTLRLGRALRVPVHALRALLSGEDRPTAEAEEQYARVVPLTADRTQRASDS